MKIYRLIIIAFLILQCYWTFGQKTSIEFEQAKDSIEFFIRSNNKTALWGLTSTSFRKTVNKSDFYSKIDNLNKILENTSPSTKSKGIGIKNNSNTKTYETVILPKNWFSVFSNNKYNDPPELEYAYELIKLDSGCFIEQFKFSDDYLDKRFKIKKYVENLFNNRDSLLLSFWFPSNGTGVKTMSTDTSKVFILLADEITDLLISVNYLEYPYTAKSTDFLACISFNLEVTKNPKKRIFTKDDMFKIDFDIQNLVDTSTPSNIYLPKLEIIFSITGNDNRLFISTGEKFAAYRTNNLNALRKIIIDEFKIAFKDDKK